MKIIDTVVHRRRRARDYIDYYICYIVDTVAVAKGRRARQSCAARFNDAVADTVDNADTTHRMWQKEADTENEVTLCGRGSAGLPFRRLLANFHNYASPPPHVESCETMAMKVWGWGVLCISHARVVL